MPLTLAQQLGIEKIGPGEFMSKELPDRMGNPLPFSYGGCTVGIATHAACATVPGAYSLYSLAGHFHGPTGLTAKLHCKVYNSRDTKTFATRRVVAQQQQPDGKVRTVMEILVDFHVREVALLTYSAPPSIKYKGPDQSLTLDEYVQKAIAEGLVKEDPLMRVSPMFRLQEGYFETRVCAEGVTGQTLMGVLPERPTDQDRLPITDRTSANWARSRVALATAAEQAAVVAFYMDGGLAFSPVFHNHMLLAETGAASTLDFALRVFTPDLDLNKWHLREMKTIVAGHGRTYSESRLWDERGELVASNTQQCILRPKAAEKAPRNQKAAL